MKTCSKCGETKPLEEFAVHNRHRDGRQAYCRECKRKHDRERRRSREYRQNEHLRAKYGITLDDFRAMADAQGHRCAVCGTDKPGGRSGVWNVDHDHETGEIRGLLCWDCNAGIGKLGDTLAGVMRAADYLRNPPARQLKEGE